jgi:hypothetical protein
MSEFCLIESLQLRLESERGSEPPYLPLLTKAKSFSARLSIGWCNGAELVLWAQVRSWPVGK